MSKAGVIILQKKVLRFVLPVVLVTIIAGCASTDAAKQIKSFSDAAILTADNTTQAFKLVEDSHFKEEISEAVLNYDNKAGFNPDLIRPFMEAKALQARLDVLNGLKSYAANLSALMGNGPLTNLDQDTTKLGSALSAVDTNLVQDSFFETAPATKEELQIFTAAVNALGHWLITYKEQKEAKQAMATMQQPVAGICQLLQKDLAILGQQLRNDHSQTLLNENQYLLTNPGDRRAAIGEMAVLTREMKNDAAIFALMESATARLAATHNAMGDLFSKDTASIRSLIGEFSAEAQRIAAYYGSLQAAK